MSNSRNWSIVALLALIVAILSGVFAFTGWAGYVYSARYPFLVAAVVFILAVGGSVLLSCGSHATAMNMVAPPRRTSSNRGSPFGRASTMWSS
jgi:membrane protein implicated in regulation of membrane protease activity